MAVSQADICLGLKDIGVVRGDALLVHSSLRSFGYVQGGADAVIDALLEAVGDQGTVLVPTLTFSILKVVPYRFSAKHTRSTTGRITEVFRQRPQARRSLHPVSSAAAIGPHAAYLTAAHLDTPCGPGSPYYRLFELGGKVVFFGATLGSNSLFHCAEEIVSPSYLGYATIESANVADLRGRQTTFTARRYDCFDRGVIRHLGNMEPVFTAHGILRQAKIGESKTLIMDAKDDVGVSCEVLRMDPDYILKPLS